MAKWKIDLGVVGKSLRGTINNGGDDLESCKNTISALKVCYEVLKSRLSDEDWQYAEGEYDYLQTVEHVLNLEEADMEDRLMDLGYSKFNMPLEAVNDLLTVFYDLCDSKRIWIGV